MGRFCESFNKMHADGTSFDRRLNDVFQDSKFRRVPKLLPLGDAGFSLVEMLVVLALLAILAGITLPYAEVAVKRDKEMELHRDLREMRDSIDRFHEDWQDGVIAKMGPAVSDEGYPRNLDVLVNGVEQSGPRPAKRKYLRRIPENPFGDKTLPTDQHWGLRSYQDRGDSFMWSGSDVYDVYCPGLEKSLDGSYYHDW